MAILHEDLVKNPEEIITELFKHVDISADHISSAKEAFKVIWFIYVISRDIGALSNYSAHLNLHLFVTCVILQAHSQQGVLDHVRKRYNLNYMFETVDTWFRTMGIPVSTKTTWARLCSAHNLNRTFCKPPL